MGFFQFGQKVELGKEYSFEDIPVFSTLTQTEQRLIQKRARLVSCKRNDIIYRGGTPSEAFYVVLSGRFRLYKEAQGSTPEETLLFFYRGDHFGETSLLTGHPHSATVEAKRDGVLLKLDKEDFLKLVNDISAISLHLSRSLGHRLTRTPETKGHREVKTIAFYSTGEFESSSYLWVDLASAIVRETRHKVVLVDLVGEQRPLIKTEFSASVSSFDLLKQMPSQESDLKNYIVKHPSGFDYLHIKQDDDAKGYEDRVQSLITVLTYQYNYLLLCLPSQIGHVTFKVLNRSDMVYAYGGPDAESLDLCAAALTEFQQGFGFSYREIRVIVPETTGSAALNIGQQENILHTKIFSVLPKRESKERYCLTVRYFAKELAGTLIGLALGSGAAYGLAHIGVLRVLEKEGIPVDVIAGSSIGALIGSLWAAGYTSDDMERVAKAIDKKNGFFKLIGFQDLSLAHWGFIKGNQIVRFLKNYLGDKTFQDLNIPVKVTATDVYTAEEIVFDTGSIVEAVRASISIPGIFRPVPYKDTFLIDGGVVDPLPVRVLTKMGIRKIIAVNVLPGTKERTERDLLRKMVKEKNSGLQTKRSLWSRLKPSKEDKMSGRYSVNIFNVIMNTVQFMEYEMAQAWGDQADVLIHPVVHEGHWAEFYAPDKFIQIGEERTRAKLQEIKGLLVE